MFVMCEKIDHANRIGRWLVDPMGGGFDSDEVLVIHTDDQGEVTEAALPELRRQARDVDEPENPVRVVVSVLVLREGWDVRNVTTVLGLRPGTAAAGILPEQAVGRGLRLMLGVSPDSTQVLEVLGSAAFEDFVRQLESEGVHIRTETKAPKPPITVTPTSRRAAYDIKIPRTPTYLARRYENIADVDIDELPTLFESSDSDDSASIHLRAEAAVYGYDLGEIEVEDTRVPLVAEVVAAITRRTEAAAGLTFDFARVVPIVKRYLSERCFGDVIDLEEDKFRRFLGHPGTQEVVAGRLGAALGELTAEREPITIEGNPIRLSETSPFLWRREHLVCKRTIFNAVATFNAFESAFAQFLDSRAEVDRFAALAETFTGFAVQYVKPSGASGLYYPDWVVVQSGEGQDANWIIETKGRVWEGTDKKDAAVTYWCDQVSALTGIPWRYVRVNQTTFESQPWTSFQELVDAALRDAA
jgi:type III restriction enzyme